MKKYVLAAGITKAISPHSIRHTVGTNMAINEAPLLVIQQFLGFSDPKTTMRYIRRADGIGHRAYQYNTLPLLRIDGSPFVRIMEGVLFHDCCEHLFSNSSVS